VSIKAHVFEFNESAMNRIREWFSSGFITTKEVVADKYVSIACIAVFDSIFSIELSICTSFIIGDIGVAIARTIAGVCVIIDVAASITH
jgi:hypothetical protein